MAQSKWRTSFQAIHDKTFAGLDRIGAQVNKGAGKLGMEAFWPGPMVGEIEKAARILRTFTSDELLEVANTKPDDAKKTQKVLVKIPQNLIRGAQGLAIFTVFRTGLGFSAASGGGVVISRDREGTWGPPSGILIHTIGFGFLAGADVYDVVLILRTRKAVKAFANPKVSLGAELSVAAGPLGAGAMLDTGIEASPVLSYVKSKGLYGGVQVDGNIIIERKDENARFYGRSIKASEILAEDSRVEVPPGSEILHIAIAAAEGWVSSTEEKANHRRREEYRRSHEAEMYGEEAVEEMNARRSRASVNDSRGGERRYEEEEDMGTINLQDCPPLPIGEKKKTPELVDADVDDNDDDEILLHDQTLPPPRTSTSSLPPPPLPPRRGPVSDPIHQF